MGVNNLSTDIIACGRHRRRLADDGGVKSGESNRCCSDVSVAAVLVV